MCWPAGPKDLAEVDVLLAQLDEDVLDYIVFVKAPPREGPAPSSGYVPVPKACSLAESRPALRRNSITSSKSTDCQRTKGGFGCPVIQPFLR
jgi:hypothetical protein